VTLRGAGAGAASPRRGLKPGAHRGLTVVGRVRRAPASSTPPPPRRRAARARGLALAGASLAALIAVSSGADDHLPPALRGVGLEQHLDAALPLELPFRDENGAAVRLGDYFGHGPVILALVYYECPMLCTEVLNGLVKSLGVLSFEVGKDLSVVAVSFEPHDTPALAAAKKASVLARYGRPQASAGWHFLVGDEPAISRLAETVGFHYAYDAANRQYAHATAIMLVTPDGRLSRYLYGVEYSPRDLRLGLVEASANRIGSVVDQVLLFCFHYDPAVGKYGAVVMNLVRLGGVATVLALGTAIVVLRRRERS